MGNFSLMVSERIGTLRKVLTKVNSTDVREMFDENRRVAYHQIEETLGLNS